MKKFYCNGKKGFCERDLDCEASDTREICEFFDETGGEYIIVDGEEAEG